MRKCALLLLAAVLSLAFAPAPLTRPEPVKDDLKQMQGTWLVVSCTFEGRPIGEGIAHRMVIAGDRMTFFYADGGVASKWAFALGPKASPRSTDAKREDAPDYPACRGVYAVKGDTLTKCYVYGEAARPTDFDGSRPGRWVDVLRRQKP